MTVSRDVIKSFLNPAELVVHIFKFCLVLLKVIKFVLCTSAKTSADCMTLLKAAGVLKLKSYWLKGILKAALCCITGVPDRRSWILEVVIVRRLVTWVMGIWSGEGVGKD